MLTMTVSRFLNNVERKIYDLKNNSFLLAGVQGIGKTAVVELIAGMYGITTVIHRRVAQETSGDVSGIPDISGSAVKWVRNDWFVTAQNEPCVIFLDELDRSYDPNVINSYFQLVEQTSAGRGIGMDKIHPDSIVIGAVNGIGRYAEFVGGGTVDLKSNKALQSRFRIIELIPDIESFLKWFKTTKSYNSIIAGFLKKNPQFLHNACSPDAENESAWEETYDPRSWTALAGELNRLQDVDLNESDRFDLTGIFMPSFIQVLFLEYWRSLQQFGSEDLLKSDSEAPVRTMALENQIDFLGQVTVAIEQLGKKDGLIVELFESASKLNNLFGFISRLDAEIAVSASKEITKALSMQLRFVPESKIKEVNEWFLRVVIPESTRLLSGYSVK